jgi:SAM-dependent methyltransferase
MTYNPGLYDAVTPASFAGDVEWYRRRAREAGGPVLELGAGTGRITLPLAQDGVEVHALDADGRMLAALGSKVASEPPEVRDRITLVEADMRSFELTERFALVIAPFRAFLHNVTEQDQLACLSRVREHLRPDGAFAFNTFHPSLEFMAQNAGALTSVWRARGVFERPDGGYVVRSEANRYDTVHQRVHSLHRYEEYGADAVLVRTSLHRLELAYLYPADIERLLTRAGFTSIHIAGGFDGRPFSHDMDELVIEARPSPDRAA